MYVGLRASYVTFNVIVISRIKTGHVKRTVLPMIGVLSEEVGVKSVTTNWNTKNASRTVMLNDIFSSESDGSQNTCNAALYIN